MGPYDMCVKPSHPERLEIPSQVTCTKRWCFAWASCRRKAGAADDEMDMPHVVVSACPIKQPLKSIIYRSYTLYLRPTTSHGSQAAFGRGQPLLGRPATRSRAELCPSAACIYLLGPHGVACLDAHYLFTSHSSGEYEARSLVTASSCPAARCS